MLRRMTNFNTNDTRVRQSYIRMVVKIISYRHRATATLHCKAQRIRAG